MRRRAHRPARWLLSILGIGLASSFYPLYSLLDKSGSHSPVHVLLLALGAAFYTVYWLLRLWVHQRYERLRVAHG